MIIILIILSLFLGGYSLYLIKKTNKETNIHLNNVKIKLHEKTLYLLDELDSKIKANEELILNKLKEINNQNQKNNNTKHQQLISKEFKKLRLDINKDLNDIVESVKNIKVF
jgi:cell division protein FtsX